jgi:hypothetical protein
LEAEELMLLFHNGRRHVDYRASWALAREQLAALQVEFEMIKRERDEYSARLRELSAAVQERWAAEAKLRALYRRRDIERAQKAERDVSQPLQ